MDVGISRILDLRLLLLLWTSASHRILDLPLSNTSPIAVMDVGISPYTRLTIVQYVSYCCYGRRHLTVYQTYHCPIRLLLLLWTSASHRILDLPLSNTSPIAVIDVGISPYTRLTIVQYVSYCCYGRRHLTVYQTYHCPIRLLLLLWTSASHRILDLPLSNTSPIAVMDVGISPYTRLTIVQYVSYCCYGRRHLTIYQTYHCPIRLLLLLWTSASHRILDLPLSNTSPIAVMDVGISPHTRLTIVQYVSYCCYGRRHLTVYQTYHCPIRLLLLLQTSASHHILDLPLSNVCYKRRHLTAYQTYHCPPIGRRHLTALSNGRRHLTVYQTYHCPIRLLLLLWTSASHRILDLPLSNTSPIAVMDVGISPYTRLTIVQYVSYCCYGRHHQTHCPIRLLLLLWNVSPHTAVIPLSNTIGTQTYHCPIRLLLLLWTSASHHILDLPLSNTSPIAVMDVGISRILDLPLSNTSPIAVMDVGISPHTRLTIVQYVSYCCYGRRHLTVYQTYHCPIRLLLLLWTSASHHILDLPLSNTSPIAVMDVGISPYTRLTIVQYVSYCCYGRRHLTIYQTYHCPIRLLLLLWTSASHRILDLPLSNTSPIAVMDVGISPYTRLTIVQYVSYCCYGRRHLTVYQTYHCPIRLLLLLWTSASHHILDLPLSNTSPIAVMDVGISPYTRLTIVQYVSYCCYRRRHLTAYQTYHCPIRLLLLLWTSASHRILDLPLSNTSPCYTSPSASHHILDLPLSNTSPIAVMDVGISPYTRLTIVQYVSYCCYGRRHLTVYQTYHCPIRLLCCTSASIYQTYHCPIRLLLLLWTSASHRILDLLDLPLSNTSPIAVMDVGISPYTRLTIVQYVSYCCYGRRSNISVMDVGISPYTRLTIVQYVSYCCYGRRHLTIYQTYHCPIRLLLLLWTSASHRILDLPLSNTSPIAVMDVGISPHTRLTIVQYVSYCCYGRRHLTVYQTYHCPIRLLLLLQTSASHHILDLPLSNTSPIAVMDVGISPYTRLTIVQYVSYCCYGRRHLTVYQTYHCPIRLLLLLWTSASHRILDLPLSNTSPIAVMDVGISPYTRLTIVQYVSYCCYGRRHLTVYQTYHCPIRLLLLLWTSASHRILDLPLSNTSPIAVMDVGISPYTRLTIVQYVSYCCYGRRHLTVYQTYHCPIRLLLLLWTSASHRILDLPLSNTSPIAVMDVGISPYTRLTIVQYVSYCCYKRRHLTAYQTYHCPIRLLLLLWTSASHRILDLPLSNTSPIAVIDVGISPYTRLTIVQYVSYCCYGRRHLTVYQTYHCPIRLLLLLQTSASHHILDLPLSNASPIAVMDVGISPYTRLTIVQYVSYCCYGRRHLTAYQTYHCPIRLLLLLWTSASHRILDLPLSNTSPIAVIDVGISPYTRLTIVQYVSYCCYGRRHLTVYQTYHCPIRLLLLDVGISPYTRLTIVQYVSYCCYGRRHLTIVQYTRLTIVQYVSYCCYPIRLLRRHLTVYQTYHCPIRLLLLLWTSASHRILDLPLSNTSPIAVMDVGISPYTRLTIVQYVSYCCYGRRHLTVYQTYHCPIRLLLLLWTSASHRILDLPLSNTSPIPVMDVGISPYTRLTIVQYVSYCCYGRRHLTVYQTYHCPIRLLLLLQTSASHRILDLPLSNTSPIAVMDVGISPYTRLTIVQYVSYCCYGRRHLTVYQTYHCPIRLLLLLWTSASHRILDLPLSNTSPIAVMDVGISPYTRLTIVQYVSYCCYGRRHLTVYQTYHCPIRLLLMLWTSASHRILDLPLSNTSPIAVMDVGISPYTRLTIVQYVSYCCYKRRHLTAYQTYHCPIRLLLLLWTSASHRILDLPLSNTSPIAVMDVGISPHTRLTIVQYVSYCCYGRRHLTVYQTYHCPIRLLLLLWTSASHHILDLPLSNTSPIAVMDVGISPYTRLTIVQYVSYYCYRRRHLTIYQTYHCPIHLLLLLWTSASHRLLDLPLSNTSPIAVMDVGISPHTRLTIVQYVSYCCYGRRHLTAYQTYHCPIRLLLLLQTSASHHILDLPLSNTSPIAVMDVGISPYTRLTIVQYVSYCCYGRRHLTVFQTYHCPIRLLLLL